MRNHEDQGTSVLEFLYPCLPQHRAPEMQLKLR